MNPKGKWMIGAALFPRLFGVLVASGLPPGWAAAQEQAVFYDFESGGFADWQLKSLRHDQEPNAELAIEANGNTYLKIAQTVSVAVEVSELDGQVVGKGRGSVDVRQGGPRRSN